MIGKKKINFKYFPWFDHCFDYSKDMYDLLPKAQNAYAIQKNDARRKKPNSVVTLSMKLDYENKIKRLVLK